MASDKITPFPLDINPPSAGRAARPMSAPAPAPSTRTQCARPPSFSLSGPVSRLLDPFSTASSERDRDSMASPARSSGASVAATSPTEQQPILTLKLSGPSFLDTVIRDTVSKQPLYIIETVRDLTSVYRLDSRLNEAGKAAAVQWPPSLTTSAKGKGKSGKSVQMGSGSWRDAEDLLKTGALGNIASRKFNLPHYPHTLKWKLIPGNSYVNARFTYFCSTSAVKGPIAVLDAAVLSASPRIRIYETLISQELVRSQQNHSGVPTLLLDYLITTAMLLTTTNQEWLDRPENARIPGSSSRTVQKWMAIIHSRPVPPADDLGREDEREDEREDDEPSSPTTLFSRRTSSSLWDVRTTYSSGSGSGSGGSEHVMSPTTPATTVSTQSGFSFARHGHSSLNQEQQVPPVPPLPALPQPQQPQYRLQLANPGPSVASSSKGMAAEVPRSHSPTPSMVPSVASPAYEEVVSSSHPFAAWSIFPRPSSVSSMRRRQLPTPPVAQSEAQRPSAYAQMHAHAQDLSRASSSPSPNLSAQNPALYPNASAPRAPGASSTDTSARAYARRSMRSVRSIPLAPPPPQAAMPLPLPPKLAAEASRGESSSSGQSAVPARYQQELANALQEGELVQGISALALSPPTGMSSPPYAPPTHAYSPPADPTAMHMDVGRVRASFAHVPREAETESIYEMPPPAYDDIDFSLRIPGMSGRGRRRNA
ncbi:hypothetical protein IEO21_04502 [Rhodonia placenta]|uniref:Uncharacterized protein n=1 Tax=Rhodonia placenta TaxID=104341 RepID=A0A8H7U2Y1_9APHY|nr:hypothetical protein IEO21_04502 [Postia placenta]